MSRAGNIYIERAGRNDPGDADSRPRRGTDTAHSREQDPRAAGCREPLDVADVMSREQRATCHTRDVVVFRLVWVC